jgi:hypothetical protein
MGRGRGRRRGADLRLRRWSSMNHDGRRMHHRWWCVKVRWWWAGDDRWWHVRNWWRWMGHRCRRAMQLRRGQAIDRRGCRCNRRDRARRHRMGDAPGRRWAPNSWRGRRHVCHGRRCDASGTRNDRLRDLSGCGRIAKRRRPGGGTSSRRRGDRGLRRAVQGRQSLAPDDRARRCAPWQHRRRPDCWTRRNLLPIGRRLRQVQLPRHRRRNAQRTRRRPQRLLANNRPYLSELRGIQPLD